MDKFVFQDINLRSCLEVNDLYVTTILEYDIDLKKAVNVISKQDIVIEKQDAKIENLSSQNVVQKIATENCSKALKRQERKTNFAWWAGGSSTALLAAAFIWAVLN